MSERITGYEHDGLRFDVDDAGPLDADAAHTVVLLHGFPERNTCWREVAPLLHAAGLRTLAPDQRGYSRGARPPRRRDYIADRLAGDVAALIEQAAPGERVHVVGHDWGSAVAWTLAATRPDLVASLTAVSVPHPAAFVSSILTTRQALKSWYMAFFQLPAVPEWAARRAGGPMDRMLGSAGMTAADVARFRREIVEDGALTTALNYYRALPMTDRGSLRTHIAVPTTLVWSDGDTALGREGVDRTPPFVDAAYELVVLPGVSHWIPTQAPQALADAILARVAAS